MPCSAPWPRLARKGSRPPAAAPSGGKGKQQGGDGIIRSYRFLSTGQVSLLTERREMSPYGLQGGTAGRPGENLLVRHGKSRKLAGKINLVALPGDRLIIKTPGGGGWGSPG
ncbi:MAG: hydantoinase B/oxoprolinase family protein [Thermodesulfobacteriota bacterium]